MQVAYHCADTLPNKMSRLPLERFNEAIDWLKARPEVDPGRIGIIGYSGSRSSARGGRAPSGCPCGGGRNAVVCRLGRDEPADHDFRRSAIAMTECGNDVPSLPYRLMVAPAMWDIRGAFEWLAKVRRASRGFHPGSSRTAVPILLICGDADLVWPSCEMAEMIRARLVQQGKAAPVLLRYPTSSSRPQPTGGG